MIRVEMYLEELSMKVGPGHVAGLEEVVLCCKGEHGAEGEKLEIR